MTTTIMALLARIQLRSINIEHCDDTVMLFWLQCDDDALLTVVIWAATIFSKVTLTRVTELGSQ